MRHLTRVNRARRALSIHNSVPYRNMDQLAQRVHAEFIHYAAPVSFNCSHTYAQRDSYLLVTFVGSQQLLIALAV